MAGYPIELDVTGKTALVVGLGAVGRRKAAGLLAAGARVVAVDPKADDADEAGGRGLPAGVERRVEAYRVEHLRGVALACAAATPGVNRRVVADARAAGVWVNAADDPAAGDFTVPAVWRDGALTLTVSTAGASPALAVALRDRAAGALPAAAAGLAGLLAEVRPRVLALLAGGGVDAAVRRRVLADWGDPRWLARYAAAGPEAVRAEVLRAAAEAASGLPPAGP